MKPINIENMMGHSTGISESYYRPTENDLLQEYLKCVDALSVNDGRTLQKKVEDLANKSKDNELMVNAKLLEKEKEIQLLRHRDSMNTDAIGGLTDKLMKLVEEVEQLKKKGALFLDLLRCYYYAFSFFSLHVLFSLLLFLAIYLIFH